MFESEGEGKVAVFDSGSDVDASEDLRVGTVVSDESGPEQASNGDIGFSGVGLDGPRSFRKILSDGVEEVELEESIVSGDLVFFLLGLRSSEVLVVRKVSGT